jgi:hypothetical protein
VSVSTLAASFQRYRDLRAGILPSEPPRKKREAEYRHEEVIAWLESRWFGATRRQIAAAFPQYYPTLRGNSASERLLHRDLLLFLRSGKFVRVGDVRFGSKIVRADRARNIV